MIHKFYGTPRSWPGVADEIEPSPSRARLCPTCLGSKAAPGWKLSATGMFERTVAWAKAPGWCWACAGTGLARVHADLRAAARDL